MLNGHLLGIYEKAFPSEWDWAKKFEAAQSLGFDFFEISIDESDARLPAWTGLNRSSWIFTGSLTGQSSPCSPCA